MSSMRSLFILALLSAPGAVAAENEATQVTPQLRQRAEDLAGAASNRFSELLDNGAACGSGRPADTREREWRRLYVGVGLAGALGAGL